MICSLAASQLVMRLPKALWISSSHGLIFLHWSWTTSSPIVMYLRAYLPIVDGFDLRHRFTRQCRQVGS